MIINSLILCDFRVFRGKHDFDLTPRKKYGRKRPIVLFGGLNGAGKTTLLTAIRLVLYGKQSLGSTISQKAYEAFLADSIHRSPSSLIQASNSWIELSFSYSREDTVHCYKVKRSWNKTRRDIKEFLTIEDNGKQLSSLSREQCQVFLSELIPLGLSELFFFDGEKVADLAEDQTGKVLQHAFRKLMGLDIVDRLNKDLATIVRNAGATSQSEDIKNEIAALETQCADIQNAKEQATIKIEETTKQVVDIQARIDQISKSLEESGGTWIKTKKEDETKKVALEVKQEHLKSQLQQLFSDVLPLAIIREKVNALVNELKEIHDWRTREHLRTNLASRLEQLKVFLAKQSAPTNLDPAIQEAFGDLLASDPEIPGLLTQVEITNRQLETFRHCADELIPSALNELTEIHKSLEDTSRQWEETESRLNRAPKDDSDIQADFSELKILAEKRGDLRRQIAHAFEEKRILLSSERDLVRKIRKLYSESVDNTRFSRSVDYAVFARNLLKDFVEESTKRRIGELEENFTHALRRLIRKEDIVREARIDPESLAVALLDADGKSIAKSDLSAGERQIYALSILEALTRTSRRKLPVIIDTPLGRLDSKHRKKLVESYFPSASHQVIILSTDTEVDEQFFSDLSPETSHAYELIFDDQERCSFAEPGYFWRSDHERAA
jgi:DNA sulfur modification protein DndD